MNKLHGIWKALAPEKKQKAVLFLVLGLITILASYAYKATHPSIDLPPPAAVKKEEASLEPKLLEKSIYMETKKELNETKSSIETLQKQLEELKKEKEAQATPPSLERFDKSVKQGTNINNSVVIPPFPTSTPLPAGGFSPSSFQPVKFTLPPAPALEEFKGKDEFKEKKDEILGDIEVISNPEFKEVPLDSSKKKESMKIYLPSGSFMQGDLITGVEAPTVEDARKNPVNVLIRVKDVAVLPNKIKANLKGCFVIASGYGALDRERVELQTAMLSCMTKKGNAVIDQEIKGEVVDGDDGKVGVRGAVVAKLGSVAARAALASFLASAGDTIKSMSMTTSISPLGSTQSIDPHQVLQAGIGGGIGGGMTEVSKLFMELARQSMPIIEMGATKPVTIFIEKGTYLEIKETCNGGGTCPR